MQAKKNISDSAAVITSVVFNVSAFAIISFLFCILRPRFPATYSPRTYLIEEHDARSRPLPKTIFGWLPAFLAIPDNEILRRLGLDAYIMMIYMRSMVIYFVVLSGVVFAVIVPLNVVGQSQAPPGTMERLAIQNVQDTNRLWAHAIVTVLMTTATIYMLKGQVRNYISFRQVYTTSPEYRALPDSRTLLIANIPPGKRTPEALSKVLGLHEDAVERMYMIKDVRKEIVVKLVNKRKKAVHQIEKDAVKYIKEGNKVERAFHLVRSSDEEAVPRPHRVIREDHHKRVVDSIEYEESKFRELTLAIEAQRDRLTQEARIGGKNYSAAFVTLKTQKDAHVTAQLIWSTDSSAYSPCLVEVSPADVVWENLNITPEVGDVKWALSLIASIVLILFWAVPIALVQSISTLSNIATIFPFLNPVLNLSPTARGLLEGVVPAAAVSVLVSLLPLILTYITKMEGIKTISELVLSVHRKYYWFLVVQVLFVGTVVAGGWPAASEIVERAKEIADRPSAIFNILATTIPRAAEFFFTYVAVNAFLTLSLELLQLPKLIIVWFQKRLLARTPRDIYTLEAPRALNYAAVYGSSSLIFTLGIVYSTIFPPILLACAVYFAIAYFVYRFGIIMVYRNDVETGGLHLPVVANHILVALIIHQLTLTGLLGLRQAIGPAVLVFIGFLCTVVAKIEFQKRYDPRRIRFIPVDIMQAADEGRKLSDVHGHDARYRFLPIGKISVSRIGDLTPEEEYLIPPPRTVCESGTAVSRVIGTAPPPDNTLIGDPEEEIDRMYFHPALRVEAPVVWIPDDSAGAGIGSRVAMELERNRVPAGTERAILIPDTARISIEGMPPRGSHPTVVPP